MRSTSASAVASTPARAANFDLAELPELLAFLHVRGVKGYLTLNTLVFRDELEQAGQAARAAIAAGVDAVLVQDLGMARLLVQLCPSLPLHASTQMTLSSASASPRSNRSASAGWSCRGNCRSTTSRPSGGKRPLSWKPSSTARCASATPDNAWPVSGWAVNANRGQCAQPCRLPYQLVIEPPGQGSAVARTMVYPMSPLPPTWLPTTASIA